MPTRAPTRGTGLARTIAVVLLLASGGALAGCGGQAEQVRAAGVYATRVNRVQQSFERDLRGLNQVADRAEVRSDVEVAVRRLSDRIERVQNELRAIRPPATAADAHAALIAAFGRWHQPLDAFRRALRDRDPRATRRARSTFGTATAAVERQVDAAAQKINSQLRSLAD